jgi:hypothetical protein
MEKHMKKHVLLICLVAAACASNSRSGDDKDVISGTTGDWAAKLSARGGAAVVGDVKLQSAVVGSAVNISISGATPGALHPWHVHAGTCANSGGIIGSAGSYPILTVGSDGRASANATISAALSEGSAYSVNVHRSSSDMGTIISCGELKN